MFMMIKFVFEWVSMAMGVPQKRWMVFVGENPIKIDD